MSRTAEQILSILEDTGELLQRMQINLKKCPKARLTPGYIEARIQTLEDYWTTFKCAHQDLIKLLSKETKKQCPYFEKEEYFTHEEIYLNTKADLMDLLQQHKPATPGDQEVSFPGTSNEATVRLPQIHLPTFSGAYEEWPAFHDLYTSLVHCNSCLSNVQKLHYLKLSVTGEAASLLRHIPITDENYELSWGMLKNRYGNKRVILDSLLKRLFAQKRIPAQTASHIKTLIDTTNECIQSISNLKIPTDSWDPILIYMTVHNLDPDTHRAWEEHIYQGDPENLPTWNDLCKFSTSKYRALEMVAPATKEKTMRSREYMVHVATTVPAKTRSCPRCHDNHTLCHCKEFAKMDPMERSEYAKKVNLCFNCLAPGHAAKKCKLSMSCRMCHKRHHTMLHQTKMTSTDQPDNMQTHHNQIEIISANTANPHIELPPHFTSLQSTALLATALLCVRDQTGNSTVLRALIDPGAQASFISERAAQALRLKRSPVKGIMTGVGLTKTPVNQAADVELLSRHDSSFKLKIKVYIISTQICEQLPSRTIPTTTWPHLQGLPLADPSFNHPGLVDMLLGVDVYAEILKGEVIKGPPGTPRALNTYLGWILFGSIQNYKQNEIITMHVNLDLNDMLKQMWELDRDEKGTLTPEEKKCEEIYQLTTTRTEDGRYIVNLPKKTEVLLSTQGNTREIAMRRLQQLERRLETNLPLKKAYQTVIQEYKKMNYMQRVPIEELNKPAVYLPHHAVVREDKETTKVRTVFNASQKGTNNISLNDELLIGPQLQDDMRSLIMRWRMKRVCFVADIEKMYLQIMVTKEDSDLQRILWRENKDEPVKDYRLMRVTFGTASAPYLAVRTLHQVAEDEGSNHPDAVKIIKQDFYMDDLMSGKDTLQDAISTAKEVDSILQKGGFKLQKWCSNDAEFLKNFDPSQISSHVNLDITLDGSIRALGLHWNMGEDNFQYTFNLPAVCKPITKRKMLADIQRLFDPLGWLAPAILPTKLLIQKLWLLGLEWDEEVDQATAIHWLNVRNSFKYLPQIQINRWMHTTEEVMSNVTIHGFCDASMRAYAAVAYLRVRTVEGAVQTSIIAAKTRVASTKAKSLPRLELCGAVLLTGLLKQIKEAMKISAGQIFAWTDSTIVLSWLFGDPTRWNTYVRNRVVEILEQIGNHNWYHVQSQDNPADIASRGTHLLDLKEDELWWKGPEWLRTGEIKYNRPKNISTNLEKKEVIQINLRVEYKEENLSKKFNNFETLQELLKVIIYCKRFLKWKTLQNKEKMITAITTKEIDESLKTCIKLTQKESFKEDIQYFKINKRVKEGSKLKPLLPYLDEHGILRVGGRLRHSDLGEDSKHPVILDTESDFTALVVADSHLKTLHGGCQLMLTYLRSKFWILKAKKIVKLKIRECLICAKQSAAAKSQLMGDLPRVRVTPARPFLNSGVDFAGPYQILMTRGRGAKLTKSYIAIFVCMSTKAIHLELVSDLTSEAFIGAFKRFVSRRGKCAHLWSDQGRNFVGANKELVAAWANAKLEFDGQIAQSLALDGTQWHFIPAYSPHMGGLWEAGVKSMKHHMKRILTCNLTYEEMTTLLCQIEACLNSRPLSPIDPTDADQTLPLTPGHFLIGEAPITVPTPDLRDIPMSHLSRWQHMQKLLGDFWRRWQSEYLSRLQQRPKWQKKVEELEIGQIVLIKNENLPPGKWLLGRIIKKHPGSDGVTRVYSVKSGDNVTQRSFSKLCLLPIECN